MNRREVIIGAAAAASLGATKPVKRMPALFLAHGADPAVERQDGVTAEQLARGRGLTAAAELLRRGRIKSAGRAE